MAASGANVLTRMSMCLVFALVSPGCVADTGARREVTTLRRQVDQMRHAATRDQRTIRELENRVFVLEDKLDTVEVAHGRTSDRVPKLPVVKKTAPALDAPSDTLAATPLDEEGVEIVYEGEALRGGSPRVLRPPEAVGNDDWVPVDDPPTAKPVRRSAVVIGEAASEPSLVSDRIAVTPVPGSKKSADDGQPIPTYKDAYAALGRHEHASAVAGFQKFLERWPEHEYADNAQYWLAETHYAKKDFKMALLEFRKVVKRYPVGNKAPDALLKVGFCYANLGDLGSARDVLGQVLEIYPKTNAAQLAAKRLEELRP